MILKFTTYEIKFKKENFIVGHQKIAVYVSGYYLNVDTLTF